MRPRSSARLGLWSFDSACAVRFMEMTALQAGREVGGGTQCGVGSPQSTCTYTCVQRQLPHRQQQQQPAKHGSSRPQPHLLSPTCATTSRCPSSTAVTAVQPSSRCSSASTSRYCWSVSCTINRQTQTGATADYCLADTLSCALQCAPHARLPIRVRHTHDGLGCSPSSNFKVPATCVIAFTCAAVVHSSGSRAPACQ